jgi:hypothetical protein
MTSPLKKRWRDLVTAGEHEGFLHEITGDKLLFPILYTPQITGRTMTHEIPTSDTVKGKTASFDH